jgi:hypothetical protein
MTAAEPAAHWALTAMYSAGGPIFSALVTLAALSLMSFLISPQAFAVAASLAEALLEAAGDRGERKGSLADAGQRPGVLPQVRVEER